MAVGSKVGSNEYDGAGTGTLVGEWVGTALCDPVSV